MAEPTVVVSTRIPKPLAERLQLAAKLQNTTTSHHLAHLIKTRYANTTNLTQQIPPDHDAATEPARPEPIEVVEEYPW